MQDTAKNVHAKHNLHCHWNHHQRLQLKNKKYTLALMSLNAQIKQNSSHSTEQNIMKTIIHVHIIQAINTLNYQY